MQNQQQKNPLKTVEEEGVLLSNQSEASQISVKSGRKNQIFEDSKSQNIQQQRVDTQTSKQSAPYPTEESDEALIQETSKNVKKVTQIWANIPSSLAYDLDEKQASKQQQYPPYQPKQYQNMQPQAQQLPQYQAVQNQPQNSFNNNSNNNQPSQQQSFSNYQQSHYHAQQKIQTQIKCQPQSNQQAYQQSYFNQSQPVQKVQLEQQQQPIYQSQYQPQPRAQQSQSVEQQPQKQFPVYVPNYQNYKPQIQKQQEMPKYNYAYSKPVQEAKTETPVQNKVKISQQTNTGPPTFGKSIDQQNYSPVTEFQSTALKTDNKQNNTASNTKFSYYNNSSNDKGIVLSQRKQQQTTGSLLDNSYHNQENTYKPIQNSNLLAQQVPYSQCTSRYTNYQQESDHKMESNQEQIKNILTQKNQQKPNYLQNKEVQNTCESIDLKCIPTHRSQCMSQNDRRLTNFVKNQQSKSINRSASAQFHNFQEKQNPHLANTCMFPNYAYSSFVDQEVNNEQFQKEYLEVYMQFFESKEDCISFYENSKQDSFKELKEKMNVNYCYFYELRLMLFNIPKKGTKREYKTLNFPVNQNNPVIKIHSISVQLIGVDRLPLAIVCFERYQGQNLSYVSGINHSYNQDVNTSQNLQNSGKIEIFALIPYYTNEIYNFLFVLTGLAKVELSQKSINNLKRYNQLLQDLQQTGNHSISQHHVDLELQYMFLRKKLDEKENPEDEITFSRSSLEKKSDTNQSEENQANLRLSNYIQKYSGNKNEGKHIEKALLNHSIKKKSSKPQDEFQEELSKSLLNSKNKVQYPEDLCEKDMKIYENRNKNSVNQQNKTSEQYQPPNNNNIRQVESLRQSQHDQQVFQQDTQQVYSKYHQGQQINQVFSPESMNQSKQINISILQDSYQQEEQRKRAKKPHHQLKQNSGDFQSEVNQNALPFDSVQQTQNSNKHSYIAQKEASLFAEEDDVQHLLYLEQSCQQNTSLVPDEQLQQFKNQQCEQDQQCESKFTENNNQLNENKNEQQQENNIGDKQSDDIEQSTNKQEMQQQENNCVLKEPQQLNIQQKEEQQQQQGIQEVDSKAVQSEENPEDQEQVYKQLDFDPQNLKDEQFSEGQATQQSIGQNMFTVTNEISALKELNSPLKGEDSVSEQLQKQEEIQDVQENQSQISKQQLNEEEKSYYNEKDDQCEQNISSDRVLDKVVEQDQEKSLVFGVNISWESQEKSQQFQYELVTQKQIQQNFEKSSISQQNVQEQNLQNQQYQEDGGESWYQEEIQFDNQNQQNNQNHKENVEFSEEQQEIQMKLQKSEQNTEESQISKRSPQISHNNSQNLQNKSQISQNSSQGYQNDSQISKDKSQNGLDQDYNGLELHKEYQEDLSHSQNQSQKNSILQEDNYQQKSEKKLEISKISENDSKLNQNQNGQQQEQSILKDESYLSTEISKMVEISYSDSEKNNNNMVFQDDQIANDSQQKDVQISQIKQNENHNENQDQHLNNSLVQQQQIIQQDCDLDQLVSCNSDKNKFGSENKQVEFQQSDDFQQQQKEQQSHFQENQQNESQIQQFENNENNNENSESLSILSSENNNNNQIQGEEKSNNLLILLPVQNDVENQPQSQNILRDSQYVEFKEDEQEIDNLKSQNHEYVEFTEDEDILKSQQVQSQYSDQQIQQYEQNQSNSSGQQLGEENQKNLNQNNHYQNQIIRQNSNENQEMNDSEKAKKGFKENSEDLQQEEFNAQYQEQVEFEKSEKDSLTDQEEIYNDKQKQQNIFEQEEEIKQNQEYQQEEYNNEEIQQYENGEQKFENKQQDKYDYNPQSDDFQEENSQNYQYDNYSDDQNIQTSGQQIQSEEQDMQNDEQRQEQQQQQQKTEEEEIESNQQSFQKSQENLDSSMRNSQQDKMKHQDNSQIQQQQQQQDSYKKSQQGDEYDYSSKTQKQMEIQEQQIEVQQFENGSENHYSSGKIVKNSKQHQEEQSQQNQDQDNDFQTPTKRNVIQYPSSDEEEEIPSQIQSRPVNYNGVQNKHIYMLKLQEGNFVPIENCQKKEEFIKIVEGQENQQNNSQDSIQNRDTLKSQLDKDFEDFEDEIVSDELQFRPLENQNNDQGQNQNFQPQMEFQEEQQQTMQQKNQPALCNQYNVIEEENTDMEESQVKLYLSSDSARLQQLQKQQQGELIDNFKLQLRSLSKDKNQLKEEEEKQDSFCENKSEDRQSYKTVGSCSKISLKSDQQDSLSQINNFEQANSVDSANSQKISFKSFTRDEKDQKFQQASIESINQLKMLQNIELKQNDDQQKQEMSEQEEENKEDQPKQDMQQDPMIPLDVQIDKSDFDNKSDVSNDQNQFQRKNFKAHSSISQPNSVRSAKNNQRTNQVYSSSILRSNSHIKLGSRKNLLQSFGSSKLPFTQDYSIHASEQVRQLQKYRQLWCCGKKFQDKTDYRVQLSSDMKYFQVFKKLDFDFVVSTKDVQVEEEEFYVKINFQLKKLKSYSLDKTYGDIDTYESLCAILLQNME